MPPPAATTLVRRGRSRCRPDSSRGDRKFPNEILVGLNRDNPKLHDVYRLDLVTGELTLEVKNPGLVGWTADAQLVVRAALKPQPDGGFIPGGQGRRPGGLAAALTISGDDAPGTNLLTFSEDGASLLG